MPFYAGVGLRSLGRHRLGIVHPSIDKRVTACRVERREFYHDELRRREQFAACEFVPSYIEFHLLEFPTLPRLYVGEGIKPICILREAFKIALPGCGPREIGLMQVVLLVDSRPDGELGIDANIRKYHLQTPVK